MYKLKYFTEEDQGKVLSFMREYPFAVVTGMGEVYPVATHLPLDILTEYHPLTKARMAPGQLVFTGHLMRNSDHHKAFEKNEHVLVIFNGPNCHVSAGWYPEPVQASTWNYITVHARGSIMFGDEAFTRSLVEDLTNKYEKPGSPAAFDQLPPAYIDRLVKAIAGFCIEVEVVENVFKLSQNHDQATRQSIIAHLDAGGHEDQKRIAAEMKSRLHLEKQRLQ